MVGNCLSLWEHVCVMPIIEHLCTLFMAKDFLEKNEMIKQLQPFYWLCERIFYKFELNRTVINIVYNYA